MAILRAVMEVASILKSVTFFSKQKQKNAYFHISHGYAPNIVALLLDFEWNKLYCMGVAVSLFLLLCVLQFLKTGFQYLGAF